MKTAPRLRLETFCRQSLLDGYGRALASIQQYLMTTKEGIVTGVSEPRKPGVPARAGIGPMSRNAVDAAIAYRRRQPLCPSAGTVDLPIHSTADLRSTA